MARARHSAKNGAVAYEREVAAIESLKHSIEAMDACASRLRALPQARSWIKLYETLRELENDDIMKGTPAGDFTMIMAEIVGDSVSASTAYAVVDELVRLVSRIHSEKSKAQKERQRAESKARVAAEYAQLSEKNKGRNAAGIIAPKVGLTTKQVRSYLNAIKGK